MPPADGMPPAIPSMWRALKRGYQAEPWLISVSFGLALLAALPDALIALWLKLLADGVLGARRELVVGAALGLGLSAVATWFLRLVSDRTQRTFRDRVTIALESHVAQLQAEVWTIEHHERHDYLDRLAVLRDQVFVLDHMYMSLFTTAGWVLRLGVALFAKAVALDLDVKALGEHRCERRKPRFRHSGVPCRESPVAVSYTHLTLPTILLV